MVHRGLPPIRRSAVWETDPAEGVAGGSFWNMAALVRSAALPTQLLDTLLAS